MTETIFRNATYDSPIVIDIKKKAEDIVSHHKARLIFRREANKEIDYNNPKEKITKEFFEQLINKNSIIRKTIDKYMPNKFNKNLTWADRTLSLFVNDESKIPNRS